jgi:hypothetical protein
VVDAAGLVDPDGEPAAAAAAEGCDVADLPDDGATVVAGAGVVDGDRPGALGDVAVPGFELGAALVAADRPDGAGVALA